MKGGLNIKKEKQRRRITLKRRNVGKLIALDDIEKNAEESWSIVSGKICIHQYVYDCMDHTVRSNMCKHIHSVMLKNQCGVGQSVPKPVSDDASVIKGLVEINVARQQKNPKKNAIDEVINSTKIVLANLQRNRENFNNNEVNNISTLKHLGKE